MRWGSGTASLRRCRLRVKGYRYQPLKEYIQNILGRGKSICRGSEAGQTEDGRIHTGRIHTAGRE